MASATLFFLKECDYFCSMRKFFLSAILSVLAIPLPAEEYLIEINPDKTIVHVGQFGFSDDAPVLDVLKMMPELVSRGNELYSNYTIQFDGKSVGEARDVFLCHTLIRDIQKIEISQSSVSTQTRNGQSGTINLIPRKLTEDGFGGEAVLPVSFNDVMPGVNMELRKGKFQMISHVNVEYYFPAKESIFKEESPGVVTTGAEKETEKYFQQTARANLRYDFNEKNVLKTWILESYANGRNSFFKEYSILTDKSAKLGPGWKYEEIKRDTSLSTNKSLLFNVMAEYSHYFTPTNKFVAFVGFETDDNNSDNCFKQPNTLDAELKYEGFVLNSGEHRLKLKAGANMTCAQSSASVWGSSRLYLSPYADFEYFFRGLDVKAAVRYQNNGRTVTGPGGNSSFSREEDVVGNVNAFLQLCPHHALKLVISRNLIRPEDNMLLPGLTYDESKDSWTLGNASLGRSYIHNCELKYITDIERNGHYFVITPALGYIRADDLIVPVLGTEELDGGKLSYTTYENIGSNDIGKFSLQGLYRYGIFTLSLGGNMFLSHARKAAGTESNRYFNIVATPIFDFKNGWLLSGNLTYFSPMESGKTVMGDRLFSEISIMKRIGNWTFGAQLSDIFDALTTDYTYDGARTVSRTYDLYGRSLGIQVNYRFGKKMR